MESDDPDANTILPQLILIVVLTMVNAFFASAEMAVISTNKNKIRRLALKGNKRAIAVEKLCSNEVKFLSTIQVGITLAGFFSSATAAIALSDDLGALLAKINVPYGSQIAFVVVTLLLSYITLVFGELYPKRVALRNPEKIAMRGARILLVFRFIATPFVKLLSGSCNLLVKISGINKDNDNDNVSIDDIMDVVTSGVNEGLVDKEKQKMIEATLHFNSLTATDIMTSRMDVFMIDIDDDQKTNIEKILSEKYTRVIVYQDSKDNILGVINIKDMLEKAYIKGFDDINLLELIRKPQYVTKHAKANTILKRMKDSQEQIVLLLDEFGGFDGIVTMEDIIEEIVGNISDEYDEGSNIVKIDEHTYLIDGTTPLHEINQELELDFDIDNNYYDTIAGLIIALINRLPEDGEQVEVEYNNCSLQIVEFDKQRILKVRLILK